MLQLVHSNTQKLNGLYPVTQKVNQINNLLKELPFYVKALTYDNWHISIYYPFNKELDAEYIQTIKEILKFCKVKLLKQTKGILDVHYN